MIEVYLAIGLVFGIANLFLVHSQAFDDYGLKTYGYTIPQWEKVAYVIAVVVIWPVLLRFVIFGKDPE